MAKVHGGQLVVEALKKEGVSHIFSISGGHIAPIYDALIDSGIKLVTTRHEQAAVMMAGGWARSTGKTGVALVTAGPGFTNAITGIADSLLAGAPVVCFGGAVATDMSDRLDLQELNQMDVIKPITRWARQVADIRRIPEMVHTAFRQARGGAPGPVYMEVPADVLGTEIDDAVLPKVGPLDRPRPGLGPDETNKVMDMIRVASKPVLVVGSGVYYANGVTDLVRFVDKTGIPTFTTGLGKGCISDEHKYCYGPSLAIRPGAALTALVGSDLIILVGTRISLFFAHGKIFNPAAKMIHLNIDPNELGRNRIPDLGLVADAGQALRQLAEAATGAVKPESFAAWRAQLDEAHKKAMEFFKPQVENNSAPIQPLKLCKELDTALEPDDILALDGGDTQVWMGMVRRNLKPGKTLDSGLFGCLGVGIPFAISAALAHPDKRVHALIGDGSLGFNFMELSTAMCLGVNITVVVNNDAAWGMCKHSQILKYGPGRVFGTEIGDVPYHKMLEALGGWAVEVDKPDRIRPAIDKARERGGVTMVNVHVAQGVISPGSVALANIGKKGGGFGG